MPRPCSHNKERLLRHEVARQFFDQVLEEARRRKLLSPDHFTVDGIPIVSGLEAWASMKSFRPQDEAGPGVVGKNPEVDFRGKPRRNDTHASTTDPEARLARKGLGKEAKLCFLGHVLTENRNPDGSGVVT